jgi:hypothetical protein
VRGSTRGIRGSHASGTSAVRSGTDGPGNSNGGDDTSGIARSAALTGGPGSAHAGSTPNNPTTRATTTATTSRRARRAIPISASQKTVRTRGYRPPGWCAAR